MNQGQVTFFLLSEESISICRKGQAMYLHVPIMPKAVVMGGFFFFS